jgi:hypothetical protein
LQAIQAPLPESIDPTLAIENEVSAAQGSPQAGMTHHLPPYNALNAVMYSFNAAEQVPAVPTELGFFSNCSNVQLVSAHTVHGKESKQRMEQMSRAATIKIFTQRPP